MTAYTGARYAATPPLVPVTMAVGMYTGRMVVTLFLAGCAATGEDHSANHPISCPATCQTTYTQCSSSCASATHDVAVSCQPTCDRVIEECLRGCSAPPSP